MYILCLYNICKYLALTWKGHYSHVYSFFGWPLLSLSSLILVSPSRVWISALKKKTLYFGVCKNWCNALLLLTVPGIWIQPGYLLVKVEERVPYEFQSLGIMGTVWIKAMWDTTCKKKQSWPRWHEKDGWIQPQVAFLVMCNAMKLLVVMWQLLALSPSSTTVFCLSGAILIISALDPCKRHPSLPNVDAILTLCSSLFLVWSFRFLLIFISKLVYYQFVQVCTINFSRIWTFGGECLVYVNIKA